MGPGARSLSSGLSQEHGFNWRKNGRGSGRGSAWLGTSDEGIV